MQELQQQAEGLIVAISSNQQTKAAADCELQAIQVQLDSKQKELVAVSSQADVAMEQLQELQQQITAGRQQLATVERSRQQVSAELSEKQHTLQVTRGECASAQEKLTQVSLWPALAGHKIPFPALLTIVQRV